MCGIIGLHGDDTNREPMKKQAFLTEGLHWDTQRGWDSTGIAMLPRQKDKEVLVYKKDLPGTEFIQLKTYNRLIKDVYVKLGVIGHNRSSTRGEVSSANAHPFRHGRITLVHNGTVTNAAELIPKKDRPEGITVDSEWVCAAINYESATEILPRLNGGFSLVWWDNEEQTLNFARNDAKPMYIGFEKGHQTMYYGSEMLMLAALCDRNGIILEEDMFRTTANVHYVFRDAKNIRSIEKRPFAKGRSYMVSGHKNGSHKAAVVPWRPEASGGPTTTAPMIGNEGHNKETLPPADNGKEDRNAESLNQELAEVLQLPDKGPRLTRLNNLLESLGVKDKTITVYAQRFSGYLTQRTPSHPVGLVECYPTKKDWLGKFKVQVFDVSLARWQQEMQGNKMLVVHIHSHREGLKTPSGCPILVASIQEDLQQKHNKEISRKSTPKEVSKSSPGFKEDWIEIGDTHKKLISPEAYKELIDNGCYYCTGVLPHHDLITWTGTDDDKPLCDDCADSPLAIEATKYAH